MRLDTVRRRESGHVMLELALASGVMLTALAGTFQFGYSFYVYNQLLTAVGNGARYASVRTIRAATPKDREKGEAAIKNMVVFGSPRPEPGMAPVASGLTPENVRLTWTEGSNSAPASVRIALTNYRVNSVFGAMDLEGRPSIEFPYLGTYAPTEREP